jgi:hypothetical protein
VRRNAPDGGFAAAEWVVALGLIMLPMVMVVASIAPWIARQTMAREISRESARIIVLAEDFASGREAAERLAVAVLANYGLTNEDFEIVSIRVEPESDSLVRGVDVVVAVRVRVPALTIPGIGSIAEVWWNTRHVEHVDDFRSFP